LANSAADGSKQPAKRQLDSEDRLRFDWAKFGDGKARLKQFTMTGRGKMQALNYPLSIIHYHFSIIFGA
jgi:hypothetical protein